MFKKTKVRSILEYLGRNLSEREVSKSLHVSRNTVAEIQTLFKKSDLSWDDISDWDDDRLYDIFYPDKFKYTPQYAPVKYDYVHKELNKTGVTLKLLWEEYCIRCEEEGSTPCSYITFTRNYKNYTQKKEYTSRITHKPGVEVEVDWSGPTMSYKDPTTVKNRKAYLFVGTLPYSHLSYVEATPDMKENSWLMCHVHMFDYFGGTPIKVKCDNLKTGVISHPSRGEIEFNESYLSLGEYYSVAIIPTGVRKPKQKASAEGTVGNVATEIIARLRNEKFTSIYDINIAIRKILKTYNERPFQKRSGSRMSVFESEEKPCLRALPLFPYEICNWKYSVKVCKNSHIWWNKGQYSVPSKYIGKNVDLKYNNRLVYIYYNRTEIARHIILPKYETNGMRTDEKHLPMHLYKDYTPDMLRDIAEVVGPNTYELIKRLFDESRLEEQSVMTARSILSIGDLFTSDILERSCELSLRDYHNPDYKTLYRLSKTLSKNSDEIQVETTKKSNGIVRGADYYRKDR